MRTTPAPVLTGARRGLVVLACGVLFAAGCDEGTPAAPFRDATTAPIVEVLRYAHGLQFDTSDAASGVTRVGGTEVRWSPERRVAKIPDAALASGRIIAVMRTTGGTSSFGSPEGISYLWVDSIATGWRGVVIPDDPSATLGTVQLQHGTRMFTDKEPPRVAVLRDSFPNGRCGNRCCIVFEALFAVRPGLVQEITEATHRP